MKARLARRHRPFALIDRQARERFISTAPIALYSAAMSQLAADRQGQARLLKTANAALHTHLCRSSSLLRQFLGATGKLKLHSLWAATSFNRNYPPSGTAGLCRTVRVTVALMTRNPIRSTADSTLIGSADLISAN